MTIILEKSGKKYSDAEKIEMAERKNGYYKEKIKVITSKDMLKGAYDFIIKVKKLGIKVAIGSSSKNTMAILDRIECVDLFDAIVDGNDIKNSKPAPDVFLKAAEKLEIEPEDCMVVEDADAGVEAALAAGMDVLAVGYASKNPKATYSAKGLFEYLVM